MPRDSEAAKTARCARAAEDRAKLETARVRDEVRRALATLVDTQETPFEANRRAVEILRAALPEGETAIVPLSSFRPRGTP